MQVYGEHMKPEWMEATRASLRSRNCSTEIVYLDDESGDDDLPLPLPKEQ